MKDKPDNESSAHEGAISQILRIQELSKSSISNLSEGVAAEKITQARLRVAEVRSFQEEIGTEALDLAKRLTALRAKFKDRIHDKKNQ